VKRRGFRRNVVSFVDVQSKRAKVGNVTKSTWWKAGSLSNICRFRDAEYVRVQSRSIWAVGED
jgi:hypothetical protein